MTPSAASRPCTEPHAQALLGTGLDDAGLQHHGMVGSPCPTARWDGQCSEVGELTGERRSRSLRRFSIVNLKAGGSAPVRSPHFFEELKKSRNVQHCFY